MYIVVFCSFLALLLTYLESINKMKGGMMCAFCILTILGVVHYDYGNDYMSYYELSEEITSLPFDLKRIMSGEYYQDPGWVILCFLFKPFGGFFTMVGCLNIIQNIIVYNFIQHYVDLKRKPFALFVYLFVTSFYLMSFSMMRQMLVTIIFLSMWKFIVERNWWIPLTVIFLCSFIHGSATVLLPFAFWGFLPMNNSKYLVIVYIVIFIIFWLFQDIVNNIFQFAIGLDDRFSEYVNRYNQNENSLNVGVGFIINMIPFILSIMFLFRNKGNDSYKQNSLVALGAISFLITPFAQIIPMVNRLSIYFGIFTIASIPLIYGIIKNKIIQSGLITLYILTTLYDYYLFFNKGVFADSYSSFQTIFDLI